MKAPPVVTEAASCKEKVREREREGERGRGGEPSGGSRKGCPRINVMGPNREPSTRTDLPERKKREGLYAGGRRRALGLGTGGLPEEDVVIGSAGQGLKFAREEDERG